MTGYIREESEQKAEKHDLLVRVRYEGGIASRKSDWERMEYAKDSMNFIVVGADFSGCSGG